MWTDLSAAGLSLRTHQRLRGSRIGEYQLCTRDELKSAGDGRAARLVFDCALDQPLLSPILLESFKSDAIQYAEVSHNLKASNTAAAILIMVGTSPWLEWFPTLIAGNGEVKKAHTLGGHNFSGRK